MQAFSKTHLLGLVAILFLVFPFETRAAGIFFGTEAQTVDVGAEIVVGVYLNTENDTLNAVEGFIDYPTDLLKPTLIMDADSIVAPWLERPSLTTNNGHVRFAGIIPGGYIGPRGALFFIVFRTLSTGVAMITSSAEQLLISDGLGTAAVVKKFPLRLAIEVDGSNPTLLLPMDETPPEDFAPIIAQDPNIFDGKWFLTFLTQDKGSGIDHYEVREGRRPFVSADSPYLLQNQSLDETIVVKALDKRGNERLSTLQLEKGQARYQKYARLAIMVLIGCLFGWILSRKLAEAYSQRVRNAKRP